MSPQYERERLMKLFHTSRYLGGFRENILILLYSPFGLVFSVMRIFILFHVYVLSSLLPKGFVIFRLALRFMLAICGLVVHIEDVEKRENDCNVIVCNYISIFDRLAVDLVTPNIMANEWGLPPFLAWIFGLKDVNVSNSRDTFIHNVKKLCQGSSLPLFTRPEGTSTSGAHALLKFSTWQFNISDTIQPVVITAERPLPIALSTLESSILTDFLWFIYAPYTIYTVRFLPIIKQQPDMSHEQFAEVVRRSMANALSIDMSDYTRHDKNELLKELARREQFHPDSEVRTSTQEQRNNRTTGVSHTRAVRSQALSPELEAMAQNCKAVVPQVPIDILRREILRTKDVDITLSNILEGNIDYVAEDTESDSSLKRRAMEKKQKMDKSSSKCATTTTYAAKQFSNKSDMRHLSLAERKAAMLSEARTRYLEKHQLPFTLEQIETGTFE